MSENIDSGLQEYKDLAADYISKKIKEKETKIIYIRFGELPENGKSKIHCGEDFVGYEKGVSVYEGIIRKNKIQIILSSLSESSCVSLSGCIKRKSYEVTGDLLEYGSDHEPLLFNCKIVRQLNINDFV
jgi:hypothetical protein